MEYADEFECEFMRRTLQLVRTYEGPHDATLLLNCLLGLVIVPKESSLKRIPEDPLEDLRKWGISPDSVRRCGVASKANPQPRTLRGIVHSLRNAVAHFRFSPRHRNRRVVAFDFHDQSGFEATIVVDEMRSFVEKLALHLEASVAD